MAAKLGALPPDDERWSYEIKWDGIRALAYIEDGRLELTSRTPITITPRYPELADLIEQLERREAILDGEIVAFTPDGIPSFQLLQPRMNVTDSRRWAALAREVPVVFEIFDGLSRDSGHRSVSGGLGHCAAARFVLRASE
jgi:bifunctional non-homologous end joining protein LigD